jgi:hypothetical protein
MVWYIFWLVGLWLHLMDVRSLINSQIVGRVRSLGSIVGVDILLITFCHLLTIVSKVACPFRWKHDAVDQKQHMQSSYKNTQLFKFLC